MTYKVMLFDRDRLPVLGGEVEGAEPPRKLSLPAVALGAYSARTYGRAAESSDGDEVLYFVESIAA
jgi:hypothetical protein